MSDWRSTVDAALAAAIDEDHELELRAIDACNQALVEFYVHEIADIQSVRATLRRLP